MEDAARSSYLADVLALDPRSAADEILRRRARALGLPEVDVVAVEPEETELRQVSPAARRRRAAERARARAKDGGVVQWLVRFWIFAALLRVLWKLAGG